MNNQYSFIYSSSDLILGKIYGADSWRELWNVFPPQLQTELLYKTLVPARTYG